MGVEDRSVGPRLGHEQDDEVEVGVPSLEQDLALECLDVGQTSLGLHADR
jgi:hypothetical protein